MSTRKTPECDDHTHMRHSSPDPSLIKRGPRARQKRRDTAKSRIPIRSDTDILEQCKPLVPGGQGYQRLMNEA